MRVRVRYYASFRELTGVDEEMLELGAGATAEELKAEAARSHGALKGKVMLVALNGGFVEPARVIEEGDQVALFPPVSGG